MKHSLRKEKPAKAKNTAHAAKIDDEVIIIDNTSNAKGVQWEMNELDALKVNYVTKYNISISH